MTTISANRRFIATCLLSMVAVGLLAVDDEMTKPIRTVVRDASFPGHLVVTAVRRSVDGIAVRFHQPNDSQQELTALRKEVEHLRLKNRRRHLETSMLNDQLATLQREGVSPYPVTAAAPLVVPRLVEASVMSELAAKLWRSNRLIDRGSVTGISEADAVLKSGASIIDQGADARIDPDQPVYAGKTVVGKIRDVGRWTSTIEHVTDVGYHGYAQLAWHSDDGNVFGAKGVLEGQGDDLCRLTRVAATEAVSVGDEVYTARDSSALPYPMYYGQVVEAELKPGALSWNILVKPAASRFELHTVQILTTKRNPLRPVGN